MALPGQGYHLALVRAWYVGQPVHNFSNVKETEVDSEEACRVYVPCRGRNSRQPGDLTAWKIFWEASGLLTGLSHVKASKYDFKRRLVTKSSGNEALRISGVSRQFLADANLPANSVPLNIHRAEEQTGGIILSMYIL